MLTDNEIRNYKENGFVRIKNIVSEKQIADYFNDINYIFGQYIKDYNAPDKKVDSEQLINLYHDDPKLYIACMNAVQNLPAPFNMASSQSVLSLIKQLGIKQPQFSTKPITMLNSKYTSNDKKHWLMPPHQDWRSIQGSLNSLVIWVAMSDITTDHGPVRVVPGSHKLGLLDTVKHPWYREIAPNIINEEDYISEPFAAGDAVIFSTFLVHKSGFNMTREHRATLQFRYNDLSCDYFKKTQYRSTYLSDMPVIDYIEEGEYPKVGEIMKALDVCHN